MIESKDFIEKSSLVLNNLKSELENVEELTLEELKGEETGLIIMDMINGFTRSGALKSERIEALVNLIKILMTKAKDKGIKMLSFADYHNEGSPEFKAYPSHCLEGSMDTEVVDELKEVGGYELIHKNSTNGFMEDKFIIFLNKNRKINNFIIVGDCSDICILQFSLSLKAYFNNINKEVKIYIPTSMVDTFDLGDHYAPLYNYISLKIMKNAGINIVKDIK